MNESERLCVSDAGDGEMTKLRRGTGWGWVGKTAHIDNPRRAPLRMITNLVTLIKLLLLC